MYGDKGGGTPVAVAVVNELVEIAIEGKKIFDDKGSNIHSQRPPQTV